MEQTVISSGSPFEVLALVQGTLGFRPRESLVLVSLRPPRWRTGLVARVDLPPPGEAGRVAELLAQHVAADGAERCFLAVVTDTGPVPRPRPGGQRGPVRVPGPRGGTRPGRHGPGAALPGAPLAAAVGAALRSRGVRPEPWLVHGGRLYSYSCDRPCCPPEGLPMTRLRSTQVAAELVLDGRVLDRDRDEWDAALRAEVEPVAEDVLAAVERAAAALRARRAVPERSTAALAAWHDLLSASAGPQPDLDAATAALLLDSLARLPLRDRLLAAVVPEAVPPGGARPAGAVAERLDADAALRLLHRLAQRARPGRRAVPLGCAAYLLWATGAGPAAGLRAEAALADDPSHSLSALVLSSVELGVPPPHVQQRRDGASPGQPPTC